MPGQLLLERAIFKVDNLEKSRAVSDNGFSLFAIEAEGSDLTFAEIIEDLIYLASQ
jgi:hypothetical protein